MYVFVCINVCVYVFPFVDEQALQRHDFHTIESASERRRTVQMLGRLGPSVPTTK